MAMTFDNPAFEQTARVLMQINPTVVERFALGGERGLIDYMKYFAEKELTRPGFGGTGGFYVSASHKSGGEPGDLYVTCTLMAFTVERYMQNIMALAPMGA